MYDDQQNDEFVQPDAQADQPIASDPPQQGEVPAEEPIPNLPESALPKEPVQPVEVPAEAMPGTDEAGEPVEQPQEHGSPESNLQTEQPDQPVPSEEPEQEN